MHLPQNKPHTLNIADKGYRFAKPKGMKYIYNKKFEVLFHSQQT